MAAVKTVKIQITVMAEITRLVELRITREIVTIQTTLLYMRYQDKPQRKVMQ